MKSKPGRDDRQRTQRESIRRTQATGRAQADRAARRVGDASAASVPIGPGLRRAFVVFIVLFSLVALGLAALQSLTSAPVNAPFLAAATRAPAATVTAATSRRVGIVSGHRGNDTGTICADGLTEAEVNFDHAIRVATQLRTRGFVVDVLDEFDPRLKNYTASALLSIHADSCAYINELATGFKAARVLDSTVPVDEDRLVGCIRARYGAATGLRFNANTITFDMTKYHAFYEIAPQTPAAIIETGFMNLDRAVLTKRADSVAKGIVDGLVCFLNRETE
ncbi:MAG TPA: N-acetylmuramoyl-L-alanine amidase [Thermoflexales bacterium]|jgi:N-acetylmuramoyl-L-alanine amidase|nr:N-acetylmuramoyl-L-alanine amidase [Anaerolineae bacterium]HQV26542.1 N-acetylmuramoyl-L-alanine amidase [Thermoflexales bacterium]HQX09005.1 N-acetylmuramoyl-L-alanine amidase [Thermoflexales bacterium]HQY25193.1 N-acetylmuramoyl-L-alanine amidase [Thermoflexales bacterium]HQZ51820.1 N-acetylmuramoyl-L-alanine amidase [Thermoflexales bacterium]